MKTIFKWLFRLAAGLVLLAVVAYGYFAMRAHGRMTKRFTVAVEPLALPPADEAHLAEGRRLATLYCGECHKEDFGGGEFITGALADIDALNLTPGPGSATAAYTDEDWVRTLRHGVKKDGRSLMIMPASSYWHLSDDDLGAIVTFLKNTPPVERHPSRRELHALGTVLVGLGVFDKEFAAAVIDHDGPRPAPPAKGAPSIAWGDYMVTTFGCHNCHGEDFGGGQPGDPKMAYAPNLTPGGTLRAYDEDSFLEMARTRDTKGGMPWIAFRNMTEDELRSVYRFLASLPVVDRPAPPAKPAA